LAVYAKLFVVHIAPGVAVLAVYAKIFVVHIAPGVAVLAVYAKIFVVVRRHRRAVLPLSHRHHRPSDQAPPYLRKILRQSYD